MRDEKTRHLLMTEIMLKRKKFKLLHYHSLAKSLNELKVRIDLKTDKQVSEEDFFISKCLFQSFVEINMINKTIQN